MWIRTEAGGLVNLDKTTAIRAAPDVMDSDKVRVVAEADGGRFVIYTATAADDKTCAEVIARIARLVTAHTVTPSTEEKS